MKQVLEINGRWIWDSLDYELSTPFGRPGDRLWVRETWRTEELEDGLDGVRFAADNAFQPIENTVAAADAWIEANIPGQGKWRPSIFMPRWASRILLEIISIDVQRVQDINYLDCIAEGIEEWEGSRPGHKKSAHQLRSDFWRLWDSINEKRGLGWNANPFVWVIEYKQVQP